MEFNYVSFGKLVTGPNEFDWTAIESLLNDVQSRGNQSIVRVYLEYPGQKNLIPKFLVDGGLKVHKYMCTNTEPAKPIETPNYEDPNLQKTLKQFIVAFGKKYDGDPRLVYITAGLLGTWGEWHTYPKNELWASKETQAIVLDAYQQAFKSTPVLLRYPAGKEDWDQVENQSRNFGYHDDSFAWATLPTGKQDDDWFFQTKLIKAKATEKWKTHPIGGEVRPEAWGCCHDEKPCTPKGQGFAECRDVTHVTWLMESGMFEKKSSPQRLKRATEDARKMGYEFFVESASVVALKNDDHQLKVVIKNTGIAPFYHSGWPLELRAGTDSTASTLATKWELTEILPGQSKTFEMKVSFDAANGFEIRVPNPMKKGKPLRFANQEQNENGWLKISKP